MTVQKPNRLKELRLKAGLKQKHLARLLKVTTSAYSLYENGLRGLPLQVCKELADIYNITTAELFFKLDKEVEEQNEIIQS